MGAAAVMMIAASSTVQAYGMYASGEAAQDIANYNASIGEIKAQDALKRGELAEIQLRSDTRRLIGSQRAAFAASGVEINDPDSTAVNVTADTAALSELDAIAIRNNAAREAWGYRAQAQADRAKGELEYMAGVSSSIGKLIGTTGGILYTKYGFGSTSRSYSPQWTW